MDTRLEKLIQDYIGGRIGVEIFTNDFTIIYGQETDYDILDEKRYKLFSEQSDFTSRYSSNLEEIDKFKVHFGKDVVMEKAKETWDLLYK